MKPTPNSPNPSFLLAFGAHPDDLEFACGGVIARETQAGRAVHLVVCSRGEAGSHGTPQQRATEARAAAKLLGATIEFLKLDGDAHLEIRAAHAIELAKVIRRLRPEIVLAPSVVANQHPDPPGCVGAHLHCRLRQAGQQPAILLDVRQIAADKDLGMALRVQVLVHQHAALLVGFRA